MPVFMQPLKVIINPGGNINYGVIILTHDKIFLNNSANNNSFNTGDGCFMFDSSVETDFSVATLGNTIVDDDFID